VRIKNCRGSFAITIDDDLQYHPEDIPLLISNQKRTDADLVYGTYILKRHSLFRNLGSKAIAKIFEKYAHIPQKGSSLKLINKAIMDQAKSHNHPYLFLDEVLGWYSKCTTYEPVRHEDQKKRCLWLQYS
jgi:undecaprenyl-phosphate 4-deoxy-4-formamido-L-arabinose transferase